MTVLQINSSLFSGDGQSTRLADELVQRLLAAHPGSRLNARDPAIA